MKEREAKQVHLGIDLGNVKFYLLVGQQSWGEELPPFSRLPIFERLLPARSCGSHEEECYVGKREYDQGVSRLKKTLRKVSRA